LLSSLGIFATDLDKVDVATGFLPRFVVCSFADGTIYSCRPLVPKKHYKITLLRFIEAFL
jgi:hypothetical protein